MEENKKVTENEENNLSEEQLEGVAGGGFTQNRYKEACERKTKQDSDCNGGGRMFDIWCDHYRKKDHRDSYDYECVKVGFKGTHRY